jgi:hypothetical protein
MAISLERWGAIPIMRGAFNKPGEPVLLDELSF